MAWRLFEATGIELEYMIVARSDLAIRPISDRVLQAVAGRIESEIEVGEISWSNELALHVIELKTTEPATELTPWPLRFQKSVQRINDLLHPHDACLMPTGMHPFMTPDQFVQWPHEYNAVYEAFDRIFDCRGHGWSNLQSMHLNLPFSGDEEFGKLHAAIRTLLPLLPGLSASSPIVEGKLTGLLDTRLEVYRTNARRIPSIAGAVIPEPVFSQRDYEAGILQRIYADIAAHDPDGILQHEWLNARGAIARFDRGAIEIRVLDVQECPAADLAIAELVVRTLRGLVEQRWSATKTQQELATEPLAQLLREVCRAGEKTALTDAPLLAALGERSPLSVQEFWQRKAAELGLSSEPLSVILNEGCLARRIVHRLGSNPSSEQIAALYRQLCACLAQGRMFQ